MEFTATEAKQKFGDLCAAALAQPVTITNHGKPRLVLVSAERMEELRRRERQILDRIPHGAEG